MSGAPRTDARHLLKQAYLSLEKMRGRLEASEQKQREPIAVIGMACRFPGGVENPQAYAELLAEGRVAIDQVPADRWDPAALDATAEIEPFARWGGFLDQVDQFDPEFFGIAPREAASMDPQQRLLLEVTWEALESAGQRREDLKGSSTGVYVGISYSDYSRLLEATGRHRTDPYYVTGTSLNAAAGRLAYIFGLQGPAVAVDTACSSSLVAAHQACAGLRTGDCDLAVVGGVNLLLYPEFCLAIGPTGALSPTGQCRTFDAAANGYVRGEGCGILVLKRWSDAQRDGDRVLALIRGSAINQDGPSSALTVPNGPAQQALLRRALDNAGLEPVDVGYIETHGTGTSLGDPIEVGALAAVFGKESRPEPLRIGAVKANIGHLESASGAAGLIKVILALRNGEVPPHIPIETLNPKISLADGALEIPDQRVDWAKNGGPRVAGVSSFGISGTNAHVLLAEAPAAEEPEAEASQERPLHLLALSAPDEDALQRLARSYSEQLKATPDQDAGDLAFSANTGRSTFKHRLALVGASTRDLERQLRSYVAGQEAAGMVSGASTTGDSLPLVFLFTGQGSQYAGMGRQLFETQPMFRETLEACDAALRGTLEPSLLEVIFPPAEGDRAAASRIDQTAYTQPALFALEVALARLWQSWGVEPTVVMGHSIGELAAACIAGVFDLESGLRLAAERGRLVQSLPAGGAMATIYAPLERVSEVLAERAGELDIAAVNGPADVVVSGPSEAVEEVVEELRVAGFRSRSLKVSHAFHSAAVDPVLDAYEEIVRGIALRRPVVTWVSALTGGPVDEEATDPGFWRRHLRESVRFLDAMRFLDGAGYRQFLEIGPVPTLSALGRRCVEAKDGLWLPSLRKGRDDWQQLLGSLAQLWTNGRSIDWRGFDQGGHRRRVELPAYPFDRRRFWSAEPPGSAAVLRTGGAPMVQSAPREAFLGQRLRSAGRDLICESFYTAELPDYLPDHRLHGTVVVPGASHVALGLAAAVRELRSPTCALESITFPQALSIPDDDRVVVQLVLSPQGPGELGLQVVSSVSETEPSWRVHAQGSLRHGSGVRAEAAATPDLEALRSRLEKTEAGTDFYQGFAGVGYQLGPAFQWIGDLWHGDGEVLAKMRRPPEITDLSPYEMHPGFVDSLFQVTCSGLPGGVEFIEESGAIYVPFSIDRLFFHGRPADDAWSRGLWCHARLREVPSLRPGDDLFAADLELFGDDGRPVVEITGLHLIRAPREALIRLGRGALDEALYDWSWRAEPGRIRDSEAPGTWLVLADQGGVGDILAERLASRGDRVVVAHSGDGEADPGDDRYRLDGTRSEIFDPLVRQILDASESGPCKGVVYLWGLDTPDPAVADVAEMMAAQRHHTGSALHLVQSLLRSSGEGGTPGLWVATAGAEAGDGGGTDPAGSPLWGLRRVLALEHPELRSVAIDLDPTGDSAARAADLAAELEQDDGESEVAYRRGERQVHRLGHHRPARAEEPPFHLVVDKPGILDHVERRPLVRRAPGPGQVEIRVHATGLNFRDVLGALGMYPGDPGPLGLECSGEVVAVGSGVEEFAPGDAVMAFAPASFASHVLVREEWVARLPPGVGWEVAATIPAPFLTAMFGLEHLAKMKAGDKVLIHAAAGGVGMAAVQLAQQVGAEIFATAHPRKWDTLRELGVEHVMSSRDLDFADRVMELTDGRGVDIVLNSLTGDFASRSLELVTPGGRFVEMGKRDLLTPEEVDALEPKISYYHYDMVVEGERAPDLLGSMLRRLAANTGTGRLRPLPRHRFPLDRVVDAFRTMAQAQHIGKVVVTQDVPFDGQLSAAGRYLITGGLGALGLALARWMVDHGARHLVLVGRSEPKPEAREELDNLTEAGASIEVLAADIASPAGLEKLRELDRDGGPPVRGVVHAAGVLDDGVLQSMSWDRFERVLQPKVAGAWNLHRWLADRPLDFFLLFSSAASMLGVPGQGSYAASNSFLDSLAHFRRGAGLAALSLNWGPWSAGGMAARLDERDRQRLASKGLSDIAQDEGMDLTGEALGWLAAQVGVLPIDWSRYLGALAPAPVPSWLGDLATAPAAELVEESTAATPDLVQRYGQARAADRHQLLIEHVHQTLAKVLGIDPSRSLDPRTALNELGVDSLMAVELRNALSASVGQSLKATLVFDYPNIEALATFLGSLLEAATAEAPPEAAPAGRRVSDSASLEDLSDGDLAALLEAKLTTVKEGRSR